jgi:hypothetical protein
MSLRRVRILTAGLLFVVMSAAALAQNKPQEAQNKPQEAPKLTKPQLEQLETLSTLVDAVMAGKEAAPADAKLQAHYHFVKSTAAVFVPYLVEVTSGRFTSFPVAVYVRAVQKSGAGSPPSAAGNAKTVEYPFTDLYFLSDGKMLRSTGADTAEFNRGLQLPPGEFDLYIAMMETQPKNSKTPPKRVVHTQSLTVPDISSGLTTSSIILAKQLEDAPPQLTPQQQLEQPFTFGGNKITPAFPSTFAKSAELLFVFFIYNQGSGADGKPEVDVNYLFYRANEEKPFSKAATSSLNAKTLPPEFNASAGHQLVVAQGIPLATFAPGDYKLEISIADKTSNQTIKRDVPFTVSP